MRINAATLALTEDCSCRCSYCFCGEKYKENMSIETAEKALCWLIKESGNSPAISIDFWGGEPMVRMDLIRHLVENVAPRLPKPIRWNMTTNGVHLTKANCEWLKAWGVGFMISMDGRKETQDRHRRLANGGSSYDVIVKHLPHVFRLWPMMKVRSTVTVESVPELIEDIMHLYDLGFRRFATSPAYEGDWTEEKLAVYEQQIEKLADFYRAAMEAGEPIYFKGLDDAIGDLIGESERMLRRHMCGAGRNYLGIGVDGSIYPCHRFNDFEDRRPWRAKEWCIGHIDHGITRAAYRLTGFLCPTNTVDGGGCPGLRSCYYVNVGQTGDLHVYPELRIREYQAYKRAAIAIYNDLCRNKVFVHYLRRYQPAAKRWQRLPEKFNVEGKPEGGMLVGKNGQRHVCQSKNSSKCSATNEIVERASALLKDANISADELREVGWLLLKVVQSK